MAIRAKKLNKRQALDSNAQAWLRGEECGFFKFKHNDDLETVWREYGDDSKMFYRRGQRLPITLEDLEERENAWLGTGKGSEYGGESFFVFQHYNDDEKQSLWESRGDKDSFRWTPGMYRPLPI
jgi:hypothetical protein